MSEVKVLIAFYSRGGVTEALANAVAEGAKEEGATVVLRRARIRHRFCDRGDRLGRRRGRFGLAACDRGDRDRDAKALHVG